MKLLSRHTLILILGGITLAATLLIMVAVGGIVKFNILASLPGYDCDGNPITTPYRARSCSPPDIQTESLFRQLQFMPIQFNRYQLSYLMHPYSATPQISEPALNTR